MLRCFRFAVSFLSARISLIRFQLCQSRALFFFFGQTQKRQRQFISLLLILLLIANQTLATVYLPVFAFLQIGLQGQRPPDRQALLLFPLERPDPPKKVLGPPAKTADLQAKLLSLHSGMS